MSIAKVAQRAGVSPATVSLVINNKSSVAPATAETVRAIIEEIGYEPPPLERRQGRRVVREVAHRLGVIALMPGKWLSSPVYGDVLHGIEAAARGSDADVLLHNVASEMEARLQTLQEKVDGLILFGGAPRPEMLGRLATLPCVRVMGSPDEDGWCDHVTYKNSAIGHLAARHLLARGHRDVACLDLHDSTQASTFFLSDRQRAFSQTMRSGGAQTRVLDADGILLPTENGQMVDGKKLGKLLDLMLAAKTRTTALFITADIAAPPVYMQLLQRGVRPGEDVEIVSCNNERTLLNGLEPRPAVVDIHAGEVGCRAAERLLWRIKNPKVPAADVLIHPSLVETPSSS